MHKLDLLESGGEWKPHTHASVFTTEMRGNETTRLLAGVPSGDTSVLRSLIGCLVPPFFLLYVLHTSRGEGGQGRYQSPQLELSELESILDRFGTFFAGDSRFDLWVHSPAAGGTLVWDRHNLVYGYGPIACYRGTLESMGFTDGAPAIPSPHAHNYHPEFDEESKALLSSLPWQFSKLRPEDEQ